MTTGASAPVTIGGIAVAEFRESVDQHMLALLDERPGPVARAARATVDAGGKRLRPLLVLAARPCALDDAPAAAAGFDAAAVRAGAAVELIHTASLVHDDLLDGADVRRGIPTVEAVAGRDIAVAAGDLLFSVAFATLVRSRDDVDPRLVLRATRVLAHTARTLAEGEAMQARQLRDVDLAEAAYLERCAAKTGALFTAALQLGSILGGAAPRDVDALGEFGRTVGIAFQVADDVLDCGEAHTEALLGKRPGADLRDGTITLPLLRAAAVDPSLRTSLAAPIADGSIDALLERVRATGAVDAARTTAHELREQAEVGLDALGDRFELTPLRQVAAMSVDRLR